MSAPSEPQQSSESSASVVESLFEVTSGAAVVVTGTIAGMGLLLAGRGLFTRTYLPSEYGLFSMAFTVVSILAVFASLGLRNGIARQIAYYGEAANDAVLSRGSIVTWGLATSAAASVVIAIGLFAFATPLAAAFGHPEYAFAFRAAAVGVPFFTLVNVATAIFRGFGRTTERVVFKELIRNGCFPLFLSAVVLFGWGFEAALYAFPASLAVTAAVYLAYVFVDDPGEFRRDARRALGRPRDGYSLLAFSFPLLFASLLVQIMSWTDILMLGFFLGPETVGIYDAVRPLVRLLPIIWGSMIFLYTPVVSRFHANEATESIRRLYVVLTKWFVAATFPLVLLFALFPALVLGWVFGPAYTNGAVALQILAVAYLIGNLTGPNGATLTALGRTRIVMWANLAAAAANITLNVALIPQYEITGAAVATACSLVARNVIRGAVLYKISGTHSFERPILLPVSVTALVAVAAFAVLGDFVTRAWHLVPAFVSVIAVYFGSLVATDAVSDADRQLVASIAQRIPPVPASFADDSGRRR